MDHDKTPSSKYVNSSTPANVMEIIEIVAEEYGVPVEQAELVYLSMINTIKKAIREADFSHYDTAPKISMPVIGKIVVTRNKYAKYVKNQLLSETLREKGLGNISDAIDDRIERTEVED